LIPISKLKIGQSALLVRIDGSNSVRQRLLRYGLSSGVPISRYATAPKNKSGVWRQGSLLIALRKKDADHLFCIEENNTHE
jgi:Fe2+ transport system protein FeoA